MWSTRFFSCLPLVSRVRSQLRLTSSAVVALFTASFISLVPQYTLKWAFDLNRTCVTRQTAVYHGIKINYNFVFHRQDWGAIVLIDERFNKSPKYTNGKEQLCESKR